MPESLNVPPTPPVPPRMTERERDRVAASRFEDSPQLTPGREEAIRDAVRSAEPFGSTTPAWMVICLLAEIDRLRAVD
jgi:hypothetical protein